MKIHLSVCRSVRPSLCLSVPLSPSTIYKHIHHMVQPKKGSYVSISSSIHRISHVLQTFPNVPTLIFPTYHPWLSLYGKARWHQSTPLLTRATSSSRALGARRPPGTQHGWKIPMYNALSISMFDYRRVVYSLFFSCVCFLNFISVWGLPIAREIKVRLGHQYSCFTDQTQKKSPNLSNQIWECAQEKKLKPDPLYTWIHIDKVNCPLAASIPGG